MSRLVSIVLVVLPLAVILAGFAEVFPRSVLESKVAGVPASIGIVLVLLAWSVCLCWVFLRREQSGEDRP